MVDQLQEAPVAGAPGPMGAVSDARSSDDGVERRRLEILESLGILDTQNERAFDEIAALAAAACGAPIAAVSLVDRTRQWFKAAVGCDVTQTPRDQAFCAHAILSTSVLCVEDALADPRFKDNPLFMAGARVRAYAGAPLITTKGARLGAVCVNDIRPRVWTTEQLVALERLARVTVAMIEARAAAIRSATALADAEAHRQLEVRFRTVFESIKEGLWLQDAAGRILEINPSARRFLGLDADAPPDDANMAAGWRAVLPDGSDFPADRHPALVATRTGAPVNSVTVGFEPPDGDRRWMSVSAQPLFRDDELEPYQVLVSLIDITHIYATERLLLENQIRLEEALEAAETASDAKSRFLANVSHEIRTPLNGVIGIATALARQDLPLKHREMIDLIVNSGECLERIVGDILDLSKVEAGKMMLEESAFDVRREIEAAATLMAVRAEEKGIAFTVEFEGCEGAICLGDPVRLKQVVANLASNAIKFTAAGEVRIRATLSNDDENGRVRLTVSVSDTGIGMGDAAQSGLFDRFFQADSSITRRYGGTGLGLAICRALVEMQGGQISVASTEGVGSVFNFHVPLKRAPQETRRRTAPAEGAREAGSLSILLAEDQPINRKVVEMLLEPFDMSLSFAEDGAVALQKFIGEDFDLILMDLQMPVMDGLTAIKEIRDIERRTHRRRTPIAVLSANAAAENRAAAKAAGADGFIAKPTTAASLINGVDELLAICADR